MEMAHAFIAQAPAKIGRDGGGDQRRVSTSSSSPSNRLASQAGTLAPHRPAILVMPWKFETGMMPGTIGAFDAGRGGTVAEAQEIVGIEEELGDAAVGAGIDLALEIVEVGLGVGRIRDGFSG